MGLSSCEAKERKRAVDAAWRARQRLIRRTQVEVFKKWEDAGNPDAPSPLHPSVALDAFARHLSSPTSARHVPSEHVAASALVAGAPSPARAMTPCPSRLAGLRVPGVGDVAVGDVEVSAAGAASVADGDGAVDVDVDVDVGVDVDVDVNAVTGFYYDAGADAIIEADEKADVIPT